MPDPTSDGTPEPAPAEAPSRRPKLHPLSGLVGLSQARRRRLADVGIRTCEELLAVPAAALARFVDVEKVVPSAKLMRLPGIDGVLAEALVQAGYRSYESLVLGRTSMLVKALARAQQDGRITAAPDAEAIRTLRLAAGKRMLTATLLVRVRGGDPTAPIRGAEVTVAGNSLPNLLPSLRTASGPAGRAIVDGLTAHERLRTLLVKAPGYAPWTTSLRLQPGTVRSVLAVLHPAAPTPARRIIDEHTGGIIGVLSGREVRQFEQILSLDGLAPGTAVWLTALHPRLRTADLLVLLQRLVGVELQIQTASVPLDQMPAGAEIGSVLRIRADRTLERVPERTGLAILRRRQVGRTRA
jgi:hypothetical protein